MERGYTVGIFSLRKSETGWVRDFPAIEVFDAEGFSSAKFGKGGVAKLSYLKRVAAVRKSIAAFRPDLVHAHYATSYGLLGVQSKFHPLIISAWGSDVYEFPERSIVHRFLVKRNLRKADVVFSTSEVMKKQIQRLGRQDVHVTPFGVDLSVYKPAPQRMFGADVKVVGTIKTLDSHYGIDVLIRAFAKARSLFSQPLKLVIAGGGPQREELGQLAATSGCQNDVLFTGPIPQPDVPRYLNAFDVFANLSRRESFGVSIIEAMACEVPVVLSNADGPKEISQDGNFASMVPAGDVDATTDALLRLLNDAAYRDELVAKAKQRVRDAYDWEKTVDDIVVHYEKLTGA